MNTVLITGGTGTFGTCYLLKALENNWHKKIIVYSRDEFKQVRLVRYLRSKFSDRITKYSDYSIEFNNGQSVRLFVGDIRNYDRLLIALQGVDLVLHSAALKHVPICEYNPDQAVDVNVVGTINLCRAASTAGVKKLVALSTDKAADPINLYGATKLCLEKVVLGSTFQHHQNTSYHLVRYGNVIGSRGSIIQLLQDQENKDFFLTEGEMTRFWISIEDAIDLTRYAVLHGENAEIFVPKMKSLEMNKVFSSLRPEVSPKEIGARPGEKFHETMISKHDLHRTYDLGEVYGIKHEVRDSSLFENLSPVDFKAYTSYTCPRFSSEEFVEKVKNTMINQVNSEILK